MLAAHQLDGPTLLLSLLAFICFSIVASSVYVLNDLLDLAADRALRRALSGVWRFRGFGQK
jgi:4-hydroxybenzoate polyprenyltransferase